MHKVSLGWAGVTLFCMILVACGGEGDPGTPGSSDPWLEPPAHLSETGAFSDLASLTPSAELLAYDVADPLWSDGAIKHRWVRMPGGGAPTTDDQKILYSERGVWKYPVGAAFVKEFEMNIGAGAPLRLETRFLVKGPNGDNDWKTYTYRWNSAQTDADLLDADASQTLDIVDPSVPGGHRQQIWKFPSPSDCRFCHNDNAGAVLGVRTFQLNMTHDYGAGISENQIAHWSKLNYFTTQVQSTESVTTYAKPTDPTQSIELRARSYLAVNCSHCHQPGGPTGLDLDYRLDTPLEGMNLIGVAPVYGNLGVAGALRIFPGHPEESVLWLRIKSTESGIRMPYLGSTVVDTAGVDVITQWINILAASTPR